jgi:hypothetical protein
MPHRGIGGFKYLPIYEPLWELTPVSRGTEACQFLKFLLRGDIPQGGYWGRRFHARDGSAIRGMFPQEGCCRAYLIASIVAYSQFPWIRISMWHWDHLHVRREVYSQGEGPCSRRSSFVGETQASEVETKTRAFSLGRMHTPASFWPPSTLFQ